MSPAVSLLQAVRKALHMDRLRLGAERLHGTVRLGLGELLQHKSTVPHKDRNVLERCINL